MSMNVREWVALFEAAGVDAKTRDRWHHLFEARAPEAHQSFLEWLGAPPKEIERIRESSRTQH
jgi:hypothetical protein